MIIFHDQKTLSLNLITASVSLCFNKNIRRYLFLKYLFVPLDVLVTEATTRGVL